MQYMESEICQVTEGVWKDFLGLDVERSKRSESRAWGEKVLLGNVRLSGGWDGTVTLECPDRLARQAAVVMFRVRPEEVTPEQTKDAVAELTNMTGGNLKSLLMTPCEISLPEVREEANPLLEAPAAQVITQIQFRCGDNEFAVAIAATKGTVGRS